MGGRTRCRRVDAAPAPNRLVTLRLPVAGSRRRSHVPLSCLQLHASLSDGLPGSPQTIRGRLQLLVPETGRRSRRGPLQEPWTGQIQQHRSGRLPAAPALLLHAEPHQDAGSFPRQPWSRCLQPREGQRSPPHTAVLHSGCQTLCVCHPTGGGCHRLTGFILFLFFHNNETQNKPPTYKNHPFISL